MRISPHVPVHPIPLNSDTAPAAGRHRPLEVCFPHSVNHKAPLLCHQRAVVTPGQWHSHLSSLSPRCRVGNTVTPGLTWTIFSFLLTHFPLNWPPVLLSVLLALDTSTGMQTSREPPWGRVPGPLARLSMVPGMTPRRLVLNILWTPSSPSRLIRWADKENSTEADLQTLTAR